MLRSWITKALASTDYQLIRRPDDLEADFQSMRARAAVYTGSTIDRLYSLYEALKAIHANRIEGDFVECGVGAGGSSVLAALTLQKLGDNRRMWLYDTFEGMPEPGEHDRGLGGSNAHATWQQKQGTGGWFRYTLDQVRAAMQTTGYDPGRVEYVQGKVEDTIPGRTPERISMLRLDTDFYASTLHELVHLYPRLSVGGVLYIDDYYAWEGAKRAVEEYFATGVPRPMLTRLTSGARIGVKVRA